MLDFLEGFSAVFQLFGLMVKYPAVSLTILAETFVLIALWVFLTDLYWLWGIAYVLGIIITIIYFWKNRP